VLEKQPFASVTVTVYVPAVVTVIVSLVSDVLHTYDTPPLAVKLAEPSEQIIPSSIVVPELSSTAIIGLGSGFTVIVVLVLEKHPFPSVTVTVYIPAVITVIDSLVSDVLQT
jgi:hypothetical protein